MNNKTSSIDWWRGAVIYQIYPRSYQDSNNDGIGDLKGITRRLPYIAGLGVDAIWISPFFRSPMEDYGYDVSDYRDVAPMFGTLSDCDELIQTAHELNIKVLVDLVISHTSQEHCWFKESRRSRDNGKAQWYVWADAKPDGTPPNNWLSIFGGPAWHWDSRRCQYYLHNFLSSQPDLNFHNPDVQEALLDIARYWLERGVDGFRLDTINFYYCDKSLRDNPALAPDDRNDTIAPEVNPYNHQQHLYDKNQPENLDFLRSLRTVMNDFPGSMALGEVGDAQRGMELLGQYTAGDDLMHMCYAFDFLSKERPDASRIAEIVQQLDHVGDDSWACWAFSNHDVERHISRWQLNDDSARTMLTLLLSLRGSICLYQGEELGLPEATIPWEDLRDPYGIEFWPEFKGRDGCRTPMVWSHDEVNGGFSEQKTWLPQPASHLPLSVESQSNNPDSLLSHYRRMIAQRKSLPALINGSIEAVTANENVLSFIRRTDEQVFFCAFNLSSLSQSVQLPAGRWRTVIDGERDTALEEKPEGDELKLEAWQSFWAERQS